MSATLPAIVAGVLGLPFGVAAGALARRHCEPERTGAPGPAGTVALAAALGALWALLAWRLWPSHAAAVPAYLALGFACAVLTVIDARTKLLPNRLTYPAFAVVGTLLLAASLAEHDLARMLRALEGAAAAGLAFLALVLAYPSGLGLGDVKLSLTLGLALGWLGWAALFAGFFGAFLLGGLAALFALVVLRLGRKAQLPFGPWLAAGALLAVLTSTAP